MPERIKEEVLDFMEFLLSKDKKRKIDKSSDYSGRKLGILESKASFTMKDDFKITDEELLSL